MSILSLVFLVLFVAVFAYTYFSAIIPKQSKADSIEEYGVFVGRRFYDYFLVTYDIIFIDIMIQIIVF
jgi:hypothetical protein